MSSSDQPFSDRASALTAVAAGAAVLAALAAVVVGVAVPPPGACLKAAPTVVVDGLLAEGLLAGIVGASAI
ncbi:hypothetical protein A9W96_29320 [Mycobacterium sp. 1245852.3]|nr:hypothetical protein A9W96_29320 [Mycobacterium sp. 1245852.3]